MSSAEPSAVGVADAMPDMRSLLQALLRIPSVSGEEATLTHFVAHWANEHGFETDLWQADENDLSRFALPFPKHLPLANRPTLVIRLPGTGGGRSLLFNAHADVVATGNLADWRHDPWGGEILDGRVYGRGACDVKGPLVSALWAMSMLRDRPPAGDVLLELIPGEEDCVGLGTLTSVARGWTANASVILEPTEGEPRCASRGGVRFEIDVFGKAVHGTVKWLGNDAIIAATVVLSALQKIEADLNDRSADPLFAAYPFARPISVDSIHGGEWQGMVCDRCRLAGYFELLPTDEVSVWKDRFEQALQCTIPADIRVSVKFLETYAGHRLEQTHELCAAAGVSAAGGFNSGCEAGLRAALLKTPTLVWGPGSLAQAHAADEFVEFEDVQRCAGRFVELIHRWCGSNKE